MPKIKVEVQSITKYMPFASLKEEELQILSKSALIRNFKEGEAILHSGDEPPEYLYVVYEGVISRFSYPDVILYLKPGEFFGYRSILTESPVLTNIFADVNSTCLLIPRDDFLRVINSNYKFSRYFMKHMDEVLAALYKLPYKETIGIPERYLLTTKAREVISKEPVTCSPNSSIREAVNIMYAKAVGSIVVVDANDKPTGILTMKDLIGIISKEYDLDKSISTVMSTPVACISEDNVIYEAYLTETSQAISHLVLVDDQNRTKGVITTKDLMLTINPAYSTSTLAKRITMADSVSELKKMHDQTINCVITLLNHGVSYLEISVIASKVNEMITRKAIELAEARVVRKQQCIPVDYVWIVAGSSAREEQLLQTDQDSAIIYSDSTNDEGREFITALATHACDILEELGIPRCNAGHVASNPEWAKNLQEWITQFDSWINPGAEESTLIPLMVFLDFRPVYGNSQLAKLLKSHVLQQEVKGVAKFLARNVISISPPFTFVGRIRYGKEGLDIKHAGLLPVVNGVKALMLEAKITANSTLERIDALVQQEFLEPATGETLKESFQFLHILRLKHQLRQYRFGLTLDNYIKASELNRIEKANLKECFKAIGNFQGLLGIRYGIGEEPLELRSR